MRNGASSNKTCRSHQRATWTNEKEQARRVNALWISAGPPFYAGDRSIWLDSSPRHKVTHNVTRRQSNLEVRCHVYPSSEHDSGPFGNWGLDYSYDGGDKYFHLLFARFISWKTVLYQTVLPQTFTFSKRDYFLLSDNLGHRIRQVKDTLALRITIRFWTTSTSTTSSA
jgi:hypothetical protein